MASTFTDQLRLTKQGQGENEATWGTLLNTVIDLIEESISGLASIDLSSGDVTLSTSNGASDESRHSMLKAIGTITANREIVVPAKTKNYIVWNNTSGAYTVTVTTSGGTGEEVPQGESRVVFCDGTDVYVLGESGTSAATASTIMARDANGRAKVAAPSASDDIAIKSTVDAVIPSGSITDWFQAAAPTGWTQDTSQNDKVLRIVSGTGGGSGGAWAISGLTNGSTGSHVLTISQIPAHNHIIYNGASLNSNVTNGGIAGTVTPNTKYNTTESKGGGGSHSHSGPTIASDGTWRPSYIDMIIAAKD